MTNVISSIDMSKASLHPVIEEMVDVLCNKTQNVDRQFFRVEVAYFLAKMASSMRAKMITGDRGEIPVNMYALALATSGFGKGYSVNIVEDQFLSGFKRRFMEDTFQVQSQEHLWKMAIERAALSGKSEDDEKLKLDKEFSQAGAMPFTFDSGTAPAVKQLRHKLLLANCGAISLQIDEIGSNLLGNVEILNVGLELYDQGIVKQKLIKNTVDNTRGQELDGKTPTNMLLFGTPSKLFDGGQTEDQFYSFLETGYARRCLFGWGQHTIGQTAEDVLSVEDIYDRLSQSANQAMINKWANHFTQLADTAKFGWTMTVERDVGVALLRYKIECKRIAQFFPEHEDIRRAEMEHRYFKALKLAGALAFVEESSEVTIDHLLSAILYVEESGEAFQKLLTREKTYMKLAKFIASSKEELTHADLQENLPFYKSTRRTEMMTLATAWGYKQHIVIKKTFLDGIEFFSGSTLEQTNLDQMMFSWSDHFAFSYQTECGPFDQLGLLSQTPNLHWANHSFKGGHRAEENVITGFNMAVVDVDGGTPLALVHELLSDYKYMTYTTKRHTPEENRFRLILPLNYVLHLNHDDYKEFMNNLLEWLPFESDEGANQRARKWESFPTGLVSFNPSADAELMDALKFIPKTSKNEQYKQGLTKLESLDNLERWFAQRIATGNRNNHLIKFALALVDTGLSYHEVEQAVLAFNAKLANGLSEDEIRSTILQTVARKVP